ncbi:sensor histidine kinase [Nocardiopsis xinjiangensis]|uniref:sensor histidine kinase n=1 Tax=Nocardiopsis xinjiangensis TaxID=124285 RepID=UPI000348AEB8|nr:histidine kinase [Nocardiopsis xinjiangensis]
MSSHQPHTPAAEPQRPGPEPAWRTRAVQVLHLLTSLPLGLFYLLPALMLATAITALALTFAHPWLAWTQELSITPLTWHTPIYAALLCVAATLTARLACRIQRERLDTVFGIVETQTPDPLPAPGPALRTWRLLFGPHAWSMVLYSTAAGLHGLLLAGTTVLLVVCGTATAAGALLALVVILAETAPASQAWWPLALMLAAPLAALAGIRLAPLAVASEMYLHRTLLLEAPQARVRRRLLHVHNSRLRMVDAAETERRRIERDLHDGAQQRLLALTLTLTRARAHLATDPDSALDLITQAQHASHEVMDELRRVARGLHPKVLTDHGLAWALPVAAERAPVPVQLHLHLHQRPSPRAEGVAYYVVCEALTNVAKHARADQVTVRAEHIPATGPTPALLRVSVADNGRGGADPDRGSGLYGLWDRLDALDATLNVTTPQEGGTVLTAHIPWKA